MKLALIYAGCVLLGGAMGRPVAVAAVSGWNTLADATMVLPELPKGTDAVATATLSGIIAWFLGRTLPEVLRNHKEVIEAIAESHKQTITTISSDMKGSLDKLNATVETNGARTHELLASTLIATRRNTEVRQQHGEQGT